MVMKRTKPLSVQMYFAPDDVETYKELKQVSDVTGMSMSEITYACFVSGFYDYKLRDAFLKFQRPALKKRKKSSVKK